MATEFWSYLIFQSWSLFWQCFWSSVESVGSVLFTWVGCELLLEQKMSGNSLVCLTACVNLIIQVLQAWSLCWFCVPVSPLKTKWLYGFLTLRGSLWTTSECLKSKPFILSMVTKFGSFLGFKMLYTNDCRQALSQFKLSSHLEYFSV